MRIQTALKSRTVWCGIIATGIALAKLLWPDAEVLDEVERNKEVLSSQIILIVQGALGVGAIIFRIKAKVRPMN